MMHVFSGAWGFLSNHPTSLPHLGHVGVQLPNEGAVAGQGVRGAQLVVAVDLRDEDSEGGKGGEGLGLHFTAYSRLMLSASPSWRGVGGCGPARWAACPSRRKAPRRGDGRRRPPSLSLVGVQYLLHRHQGGGPRPHGLGLGHGVHAGARGGRGGRRTKKEPRRVRTNQKKKNTATPLVSPRAPQRLVACVWVLRSVPSPTLSPARGLFSPSRRPPPSFPPHMHTRGAPAGGCTMLGARCVCV